MHEVPRAVLVLPPMMTGGLLGRITTNKSPYLLSVENMGASVLTSHLYLPVLDKVTFTKIIKLELLAF